MPEHPDAAVRIRSRLAKGMLPYAQNFYPAPNGEEVLVGGLPSGTAFNYNNAVEPRGENFGLARFDWIASLKDSFSANFTYDDGERDVPQADTNFIQLVPLRSQTLGLE